MVRSTIDYGQYTKRGVLVGATLFCIGAVGYTVGPLLFGQLPAWEMELFLWMEGVGILIALLAPFLFGIVLPLIE